MRRDAKKNELKPWLSKQWCIPPKANAEFVWKMEDVLEVYKRPYDPKRPVVCLDETSKQLIGEVQTPVPAAPGQVAQYDYEYVRNGVANIFMISEPLAGQRDVEVTDRRTKKDYAQCLRKIADEMYPDAEVIVLVQDNLNTHSPASCTRRSSRRRPSGWRIGSSSTTRPSTAVGWTWPRSNWASWAGSACRDASTTWTTCAAKSKAWETATELRPERR